MPEEKAPQVTWDPEPAGPQVTWDTTPEEQGPMPLPAAATPRLPGFPGKALLAGSLEEPPSPLAAALAGGAQATGRALATGAQAAGHFLETSPATAPVVGALKEAGKGIKEDVAATGESLKQMVDLAAEGSKTATAEAMNIPEQVLGGLAYVAPRYAKSALEDLHAAEAWADEPKLTGLSKAVEQQKLLGHGWLESFYEAGVDATLSLTSPAAIMTLMAMGVVPEAAKPMFDSYFAGQMGVAAKEKFELALQQYREHPYDPFEARKTMIEAFMLAGMGIGLPAGMEIFHHGGEETATGRVAEGGGETTASNAPSLAARARTPLTAAESIAQPEAERMQVEKLTRPGSSPEAKAAAKASVETTPRPEEVSAMKFAQTVRGHVDPEDVPPRLQAAISTRRSLVELADQLQKASDVPGQPANLPKDLDHGRAYQDIVGIIEKGMRGDQLTSDQQDYFNQVYAWARNHQGALTPLDLEAWINDSGLSLKTATVMEQLDREQIANEGVWSPATTRFQPTTLENRNPTGSSATVVERAPNGDVIAPLMPPEPDVRAEANRLIRSIAGGDDAPTADALAQIYGIKAPIAIERGGVRVPETVLQDGKLIIKLPLDAEPYQLAHEIMFEGRKALGQDYTLPPHDDNLVAAQVIGDLKEAGFDWVHHAANLAAPVLKGIPDPGGMQEIQNEQAAEAEVARLSALRVARNQDAIERGTALHMEIPLVRPFVEHTVVPGAKGVVRGSGEIGQSLVRAVAPRALTSDKALDSIMKATGAVNRQEAQISLNAEYAKFQQQLDWIGKDESIKLIDAIKNGETDKLGTVKLPWYGTDVRDVVKGQRTTVDEKRFAEVFRQIDDEQHAATDALLRSLGKDGVPWIANHLRLFWKVRPNLDEEAMAKAGTLPGRRPLAGTGGFLKPMVYENLSEGMKHGGIPYSYNPAVLGDMAWTDMAKFRAAYSMMSDLRDNGFMKFVARGDREPDGWKILDPRLSRVYLPPELGEGASRAGNYFFEPNVHRILSNYLSQDVIRQSLAGRGLLALKNLTTAFELAYSPFHAVFETIEAMGTAGGLSLERFAKAPLSKKPEMLVRGIADWANAPYRYARQGEMVRRFISNPDEFLKTPMGQDMLTKFGGSRAAIEDAVDNLFAGGLKLSAGQDYRFNSARTFAESLRNAGENGDYVGWVLRSFPFVNETVMKPLFNEYIPRLKMGAFLDDYSQALLRNADRLDRGEISKATIARRSVDRVEDRFGEMNWDNVFWNRTFKTAMQYVFRSATWKLGNMRAVGRGISGQVADFMEPLQYIRQRVAGKEITARPFPKLDPDFAWMVSTTLTTAVLGTIVQKMLTGQMPWQTNTPMLDAFMPRSGGTDENGRPNRVLLPSYIRDWISAKHAPGEYLMHGLSATVGRTLEAWNNKDFYGNEIYDDRHPWVVRFLEGMAYSAGLPTPAGASAILPFAYRGAQRAAQVGSPIGMPFAGMGPAPSSYSETPFEKYVSTELGRKYTGPPRRPEAAELHEIVKEQRENAELGLAPSADIGQQRTTEIYKEAQMKPFERRANALSLEQLLDGYHFASATPGALKPDGTHEPSEQERLKAIIQRKATTERWQNLDAKKRQHITDRIREIFGGAQVLNLGGA